MSDERSVTERRKTADKESVPNGHGTGRNHLVIDWELVDELCKIQCIGEEIASVLSVDYDTLNNACTRDKGMGFSDYMGIKRKGGKASLRRKQWQAAESGNATMLIWLGKQYLEQSDKPEADDEDLPDPTNFTFEVNGQIADIKVTNAKPRP